MWLTDSQVRELTRKVRPKAQMRALARAGIPFREVDGRPIVVDKDVSPPDRKATRVRKL